MVAQDSQEHLEPIQGGVNPQAVVQSLFNSTQATLGPNGGGGPQPSELYGTCLWF